jgi:hypothetical protein
MNKYTIYIYAFIVGAAVLSSVVRRIRKANQGTTNQKPVGKLTTQQPPKTGQTQPKSLEEILNTLLNENKPQVPQVPKVHEPQISSDKSLFKSPPLETDPALEEQERQYYAQDTELSFDNEIEDYDEIADHHVHGFGFDVVKEEEETENEEEWSDIDWRKAIVTAEILRRPQY